MQLYEQLQRSTDNSPEKSVYILFPTRLIRNADLRDEVEEAIINELKLISNDPKYLQKSSPLKPPKGKNTPSGCKKANTPMK